MGSLAIACPRCGAECTYEQARALGLECETEECGGSLVTGASITDEPENAHDVSTLATRLVLYAGFIDRLHENYGDAELHDAASHVRDAADLLREWKPDEETA